MRHIYHEEDLVHLNDCVSRTTRFVENTWRIASGDRAALEDYLLYRRHLFAYESALAKCQRVHNIVDVGCGLGFAMRHLRDHARLVIAVDVAETSLRSLPLFPELIRLRSDALRLAVAPDSVDVLLAFQLIEHLPYDTVPTLINEVRRVLRPGGTAYITTPNARWRLRPGEPPRNPFHHFELSPSGVHELCQRVGIRREQLFGVIGTNGAHEVEIERVTPKVGSTRLWRISQLAQRLVSARVRAMFNIGVHPNRLVTEEDRSQTWFALSEDFAMGLDFWIEVQK